MSTRATRSPGSLTADHSLDWHGERQGGARRRRLPRITSLELPENFSEAIASPVTGDPKKAQLIAVYNDANNYISSTIGRTATRCSTRCPPGSPARP